MHQAPQGENEESVPEAINVNEAGVEQAVGIIAGTTSNEFYLQRREPAGRDPAWLL